MKFNLKLFVLVGVLAGFRDVCGMEKGNKDDVFIVDGLKDNDLNKASVEMRVIKAVYKKEEGGNVAIIHGNFKNNLSYILVWNGKEVKKVEAKNLSNDFFNLAYNMSEKVEHTVYFIFKEVGVESTKEMFFTCSSLIRADFRCFDMSNVKNMSYMFYICKSLTRLYLSSFNTEKVTNMSYMFYGCSSLIKLDLSKFDTKSVTDMSNMFYGCSSLKTVYLPLKNVEIQKRCICCCVYGPVLWNNHEVGGLNPKKVQFKDPKEIIEKISTVK